MSGSSGSDSNPPGAVDITTLPVTQLRALQSRFTSEVEHLTNSHTKLRAAQSKFRDCIRSVNDGVILPGKEKKVEYDDKTGGTTSAILVPLTSSLYVKGRLASREKVIVDVGTGFYVEKTATEAIDFYNARIKDMESNLQDLEKIVQGKSATLRVIEDVLRQKLLSGEATATPTAGVAMR